MSAANGVNPELAEKLAVGLSDRRLIRFGNFTLKSGLWSPVYVNLRPIGSFDHSSEVPLKTQAEIRQTAVDAYAELADKLGPHDHILGIPEAALTLAGLVGQATGKSVLQMRVQPKAHGEPVGIEGDFQEGQRVALLDDVVTTGGAKIDAAYRVSLQGLNPVGFVVAVDREQGGRQDIENMGHAIESALGMASMTDMLLENKRITAAQHDIVTSYMRGELTEAPR